jgi:hypothetical protein
VQAVGELDQDDAHVARHRQQHLAKRFGLRFFAGRELQLVELGEAVDEIGDRRTEALDQLALRDAAVFHRVVHQRSHDGLRVELPFGAEARDRDRVRDVRLAAGAELTEVRFVGEAIGLAHLADVGGVEVVELVGKCRKRGSGGVAHGGQRFRRRASARRGCCSSRFSQGVRGAGAHGPNLTWNGRYGR